MTFLEAINKGVTEDVCDFRIWFQIIGKTYPSEIEGVIPDRVSRAWRKSFWKLQEVFVFCFAFLRMEKREKWLEGDCRGRKENLQLL